VRRDVKVLSKDHFNPLYCVTIVSKVEDDLRID